MFISDTIAIINNIISEQFRDVMPVQVLATAELVKRLVDGKDTNWPGVYVADGEMVYAGIDEAYKLIIYHRIISMGLSAGKPGYGRTANETKSTTKVSMVIFGNRDILKTTPESLALMLQALFPDNITGSNKPAGTNTLNVTVNDITLNAEQVFNEEYKGVPYFLTPEHLLLKVNYTIESTFDKRRFNTCDTQTS